MSRSRFFWLCLFVFIVGCGGDVKKSIETSQIISEFSVTRNSTTATCRARFWVGSKTGEYLELTGGDQVWCQGNMMAKKQNLKGAVWYEADLPLESTLQYTISFRRPGENPYLARVGLPSRVQIIKPKQGEKVTQGRDLTVEVTPGEKNLDETVLEFAKNEGGVIESSTQRTPGDVTSHKIGNGQTTTKGVAVANITVIRSRAGSQPDGLLGSTLGLSMDKVTIELQ